MSSAYDGRYDPGSGNYILPPLIGLPFSEMVKNGEGARHAGDHRYYILICVHGIFAALAFLFMIPAAIFCARFFKYGRNPRTAMWGHMGLNMAAIVSLTIAFVAGWFAVGEGRWGNNPHHLIGVTLYIGVIIQALFGAFVRYRNMRVIFRKKMALHTMLHHWIGRGIFLLGLAQIPLGLYLYGSPLALFISYAVFVFIIFVSWFACEFLRTRGYFSHNMIRTVEDSNPETAEPEPGVIPRDSHDELDRSEFDSALPTPKRGRFSMLSGIFKRRQSEQHNGLGLHELSPSYDTSRDQSSVSHQAGGLRPPPSRQEQVPPVPSLPPLAGGQIATVGDLEKGGIHRDNSDRYVNKFKGQPQQPTDVRRTVLRDSTTLGEMYPPGHLNMPEPRHIPESPSYSSPGYSGGFPPMGAVVPPVVQSAHTSDMSGVSSMGDNNRPYAVVIPSHHSHQHQEMPPSPNLGGGYMETNNGFLQNQSPDAPIVPLPMPPESHRQHTRGRSSGSTARVQPQPNNSSEYLTIGGTTQGLDASGQPNIAVQVKLNPDGKSVTVRRLNAEEAERERRERARVRQERAAQREISIDRERQSRRSNSGRRPRTGSIEPGKDNAPSLTPSTGPRPDHRGSGGSHGDHRTDQYHHQRTGSEIAYSDLGRSDLGPHNTYTPSIGGQSSTIAGASGGLLGGGAVLPPVMQAPVNIGQPLQSPAFHTGLGGGIASPSQRGSVVSGSGTGENSEMEQEILKEQRRQKRRKERSVAGENSQVGSSLRGGGRYGESVGGGSDAHQWT